MFSLSGIVLTFFLVALLAGKKGKTTADCVLAVWLCVIGLHLLFYHSYLTGQLYRYPFLLGVSIPFPLLHGPLLYLYTQAAAQGGFSRKGPLHFVPALAAYGALWPFFQLGAAEKISVYQHRGAGFEVHKQVILLATFVSGFAYVWLSFRQLKRYRQRIAEEYSDTEKINLNWLGYLIGGILAIWLVIVFTGKDSLIFGTVVLFVLLLGYFGIRHTAVFSRPLTAVPQPVAMPTAIVRANPFENGNGKALERGKEGTGGSASWLHTVAGREAIAEENLADAALPAGRRKYEKSGLQKEAADKIHAELSRLVEAQKVFKKEELSLGELADCLDVHPNNLSQVINSYEGKSFYDYINTLRIREFKRLTALPANGRYTLLSLAFECGFNSKTSFNRNFKKITGQSPSAYLREVNVHLVAE